jgi:hypothetical protein
MRHSFRGLRKASPQRASLHSGVGSAGEWKRVFSLWPEGYRLVAIDSLTRALLAGLSEVYPSTL